MSSSQQVHAVKPIEKFPTKARADGRFQKRIRGRLYYFGAHGDRDAAITEYDRIKHDLYAGKTPRVAIDVPTLTLKQVANLFITEKEAQAVSGDICNSHLSDYRYAIHRFLKNFGGGRLVVDLRPDDFASYSRYLRGRCNLGPHSFNRERALVVAMFNHASESGWLEHPIRFGKGFAKAGASELRGVRKRRMFEAADIRKLVKAADVQLKAMILLGVNGGFGATDCSGLERVDVDLKQKRIYTIRKKRKTIRSIPLWNETAAAIRAAISEHPTDTLVFRKSDGKQWVQDKETANINAVTKVFAALVDSLKIPRPKGVSFGALRHTFATHANNLQDRDASKRIMGHKLAGLDDVYIEDIDWRRLKKITDHVHSVIFSSRGNGPSRRKPKTA